MQEPSSPRRTFLSAEDPHALSSPDDSSSCSSSPSPTRSTGSLEETDIVSQSSKGGKARLVRKRLSPYNILTGRHQLNHLEECFISVAGLIGAGKSTLAKALGKVLNLPVHYEPVADNEYLADFYADMKKYSFPLQIYLLNRRFQQHQQIIWQGKGGVQDRTIYEDAVFAKMLTDSNLMEERDYRTYLTLFNHMANFMRKPNVIVYLDVTPETSLNRIKMRARDCETGISLEYLENLYAAYEDFIQDISQVVPVIRVNYNHFRSAEEMAEMINREYLELRNIRYVDFGPPRSNSYTSSSEEYVTGFIPPTDSCDDLNSPLPVELDASA